MYFGSGVLYYMNTYQLMHVVFVGVQEELRKVPKASVSVLCFRSHTSGVELFRGYCIDHQCLACVLPRVCLAYKGIVMKNNL